MNPVLFRRHFLRQSALAGFAFAVTGHASLQAESPPVATAGVAALRGCLGTYAGMPRRPDRRGDLPRLLRELADLGANTYNFLIWHEATDWEDLRLFLPLARSQGVNVWVTLVPPSESPPKTKLFSEPHRLDYERWATEIARLSLAEPNLVAWSIDDFAHNLGVYTPAHVRTLLTAARALNPRLAFVPCLYFRQLTPKFAAAYGDLIDGVLFPYRNESIKANLVDAGQVAAEVARVRQLFRPGLPVIIDIYASRHSTLGDSTADYVTDVLAAGRLHADGVLIYCHQNPASQPAKYAALRRGFAPSAVKDRAP
jgi:hypothetical protein